MKRADYAGRRYGALVAIEDVGVGIRARLWRVRCDCGTERVVASNKLTRMKSCGCGCGPINHAGRRYGMLTAIECVGVADDRSKVWRVRCDCGREKVLRSGLIRMTKSCGCIKSTVATARWRAAKAEGRNAL